MNPSDIYQALPYDVRLEIFKNKPYFTGISKEYTSMQAKNQFYNKYCNQNISTNELLNYIINIKPNNVLIFDLHRRFFNGDNGSYSYDIYVLEKTGDLVYEVNKIMINNTNQNNLYYRIVNQSNVDYNNYNSFKSFFKFESTGEVYYDFDTVYNISSLRQTCKDVNINYEKEYITNYFNNILNQPERDILMDRFTKLLYVFLVNNLHHGNFLEDDLTFIVKNFDKDQTYDTYSHNFQAINNLINNV